MNVEDFWNTKIQKFEDFEIFAFTTKMFTVPFQDMPDDEEETHGGGIMSYYTPHNL